MQATEALPLSVPGILSCATNVTQFFTRRATRRATPQINA
jgi:hypothetical protein